MNGPADWSAKDHTLPVVALDFGLDDGGWPEVLEWAVVAAHHGACSFSS